MYQNTDVKNYLFRKLKSEMPFEATKEKVSAKKKLQRELDDRRKDNKIKTLAETRAAKRLQLFHENLQKPEITSALRELQLIPLTTR